VIHVKGFYIKALAAASRRYARGEAGTIAWTSSPAPLCGMIGPV
jgi:hypothetical protein